MVVIGDFIKKSRQEQDISQSELASQLGISRPTYNKIENNQGEITLTQAQTLAEIFGISLDDLIQGRDPSHQVILAAEPAKPSSDIQIRVTKEDLHKFKQVLLYILGEVGSKPNVGETVIHKLLYFIDFDYFEKYEENLMGATYIKNHHGPTSVDLGAIILEMENSGEIEAVKSQFFSYQMKKYLPHKGPDLTAFSAQELDHIDEVLTRLSDKTATDLSRYSHGDIPWQAAKEGQPISYKTVFYRDERYSVRSYEDEL